MFYQIFSLLNALLIKKGASHIVFNGTDAYVEDYVFL